MQRKLYFLLICISISLCTTTTLAGVTGKFKSRSIPVIQALRGGRMNTLSNIEFWQTNYMEMFLDISVSAGKAGTFWPRGSNFSYIFGGGVWFGAMKNNVHHVLVGYNPYNGGSWFQPGSVEAAQNFFEVNGRYPNETDNAYGNSYPIYSSVDYDRTTGRPLNPALHLPNWPIWDTDTSSTALVGSNHYFGNYVDDPALRDTSVYPVRFVNTVTGRYDSVLKQIVFDTTTTPKGGPAFVSEEDMFTVCNELDTTYDLQKSSGRFYPLQTEVQRSIYSWGSVLNKDFIFVVYKVINKSNSTLDSCYLANVADPDVGIANNDECGFYNQDPTLNLGLQWSDREGNVPGALDTLAAYPGVLGFDFLESPAVYHTGEVADSLVGTIKPGVHPNSEQLGLVRFKRWEIGTDPIDDEGRYQFMTGNIRDTAINEFSDKRILMSTGPFRLLPNQSAQIAVGVDIARDTIIGDYNLQKSIDSCVALDKRAQVVYDNSYAVVNPSLPPTNPTFRAVTPGSHTVHLQWDSLSEYSFDPFVGNLDFMGYRLYRGRATKKQDFTLIQEWKLSNLSSSTYQSLLSQLPADKQPANVRAPFYSLIHHYMDSLTNHYTYDDVGDDNHDGVVSDSEQLLNFVDYVYWIAAFDQGDSARGIPSQQTNAIAGQSMVSVQPFSNDTSLDSDYVIYPPQSPLGGISHFQWVIQNETIVAQLLAGDTVNVQFLSSAPPFNDLIPINAQVRWYGLNIHVWDSRNLFNVNYPYDHLHTFPDLFSSFTGNLYNYPIDTSLIHYTSFGSTATAVPVIPMNGYLNSGDTSFIPNQDLLNTLTHRMAYQFLQVCSPQSNALNAAPSVPVTDTIITHHAANTFDTTYQARTIVDTVRQLQWGMMPYGLSLPQTIATGQRLPITSAMYALNDSQVIRHQQYTADTIVAGDAPFAIANGHDTVSMYWDTSGNLAFDSLANAGQFDYLVQFANGGMEVDTVSGIAYNVPYLNMNIRGEQIYTVKTLQGTDSTVKIIYNMSPNKNVAIGDTLRAGQWAMDPLIWKMSANNNSELMRSKQFVGYSFSKDTSPNRYYVTAHGVLSDTNYLVFVNKLTIGGNKIFLDSANKMTTRFARNILPSTFMKPSVSDFKVGDVVRIRYTGGMMGLPWPNASFITVFKGTPNDVQERGAAIITGDALANIRLWPNPLVIGKDKLSFDQLPLRCTIALYNVEGDCIGTINHTSGTQEIYDLVRDGNQSIATQLLIATIRTTGGASRSMRIVALAK